MSNQSEAKPRLLYLTEWFEPEPVFKGLRFAKALSKQGFTVEVATAFPNHPGGRVYPGHRLKPYQKEELDGVVVHRLYVYPSHDRSAARRMVTYCSFFLSSLVFLLARFRRYDIAYVYHPPIMPGFAAGIIGLVFKRPFVLEIQDLWPDSVASSGMGNPLVTRLLNWVCNFTYRRAAVVVCQSDGMVEKLKERGVPVDKLVRIYNWSNYVSVEANRAGATIPNSLSEAFNAKFNFVYGGNIGQAQSLETVVAAATVAAKSVPNLRLHLIGSGIDRARIAAAIRARSADEHVLLHDAITPREMDCVFDRADVLVMHLKDDPLYDITIPSKTQHYLSVGKPIVAGVSGESARLLTASSAAHVVPPDNIGAMATAMIEVATTSQTKRDLAGARGRAYYHANLGFEAAVRTIASLIQRQLANGRSRKSHA